MQFLTILTAFVGLSCGYAIGDQNNNMPSNMGPPAGALSGAQFGAGGQRPGSNAGPPGGMNGNPASGMPGNM